MSDYLNRIITDPTPQSEPLPGREADMAVNSAGGYAFPIDDLARLRRFLVLGAEGGSYYASERKLTLENCHAVQRLLAADGEAVIRETVAASQGRAPRNNVPLFVLATAASKGDDHTRKAAFAALPQVARTASHLFQFVSYVDTMRGWGRSLRNAVADWYQAQGNGDVAQAAYQMVKYRQRNGWSHRDLLRKAHPDGKADPAWNALYAWAVKDVMPPDDDPRYAVVHASLAAHAEGATPQTIAQLVMEHSLTWEMLPSHALTHREVWSALLEKMPTTALLRNMANITRAGAAAPLSTETERITAALGDADRLRAARVHPIAILSALNTYRRGRGQRGSHEWTPTPAIVDALDQAFAKSFEFAPQTGKRFYIAIDVSGSMGAGEIAGVPGLTPREGAAAMAMAIARRERNYHIAAFASRDGVSSARSRAVMTPLDIAAGDSLADAVAKTSQLPFGGTDCALPMLDAKERDIPVDCFIILTDSETWAGKIHPSVALQQYREKTGLPAKAAIVGMTSNGFSIADPEDGGMLDVVGFDAAAPRIIADFAAGPAE